MQNNKEDLQILFSFLALNHVENKRAGDLADAEYGNDTNIWTAPGYRKLHHFLITATRLGLFEFLCRKFERQKSTSRDLCGILCWIPHHGCRPRRQKNLELRDMTGDSKGHIKHDRRFPREVWVCCAEQSWSLEGLRIHKTLNICSMHLWLSYTICSRGLDISKNEIHFLPIHSVPRVNKIFQVV